MARLHLKFTNHHRPVLPLENQTRLLTQDPTDLSPHSFAGSKNLQEKKIDSQLKDIRSSSLQSDFHIGCERNSAGWRWLYFSVEKLDSGASIWIEG
jgi:hypothetical protein